MGMKNGCIDELFLIYSLVQNILLCVPSEVEWMFFEAALIFQIMYNCFHLISSNRGNWKWQLLLLKSIYVEM